MQLHRIDAVWINVPGAEAISRITLFAATDHWRVHVNRLLEYGWDVRETRVDVTDLSPSERSALIGPVWPLAPFEVIVDLVRTPPGAPDTIYEPVLGAEPPTA